MIAPNSAKEKEIILFYLGTHMFAIFFLVYFKELCL